MMSSESQSEAEIEGRFAGGGTRGGWWWWWWWFVGGCEGGGGGGKDDERQSRVDDRIGKVRKKRVRQVGKYG